MQRANLRDASFGGVGLTTAESLQKGELVQVMLTLDGKSWLALAGAVRHVRRDGDAYVVGVDVGGGDPHALERFREFVDRARTASFAARARTSTGPYPAVPGGRAQGNPPAPPPRQSPTPVSRRQAPPRQAAPSKPKAEAKPQEPAKRPRTRTLLDKDLANLYRAAVKDVTGGPKKPKK